MSVTVFPAPSTGSASQTLKTDIITSTGTWTAPTGVTRIELTLVGGGGGGGGTWNTFDMGGGGGGGGVLQDTVPVVAGTAYTVTIGAGGAGGPSAASNNFGARGSNSTFGSLRTSFGGGGGHGGSNQAPTFTASVSAIGGQGQNNGGSGGIGGGGGGANMSNFANNAAGNNQNVQWSSQGTPGVAAGTNWAPNSGINGYGAGGGAGSWSFQYPGGLNAGTGGGNNIPPVNATANRGGGGGGGYVGYAGSNGGSGIAIIKYWS
jgi:hypothetical protein